MRRENEAVGAAWREFGLRKALANMPANSPGRPVVEALLARGKLTPEEGRRFKAQGLRAALASMPSDSPGRVVVQELLDRTLRHGEEGDIDDDDGPRARSTDRGRADLAEQLERLARLRESGHLTDKEFDAAKRKLLS
jgi:polyhydroxyalkanoate synthesis regulator phasin